MRASALLYACSPRRSTELCVVCRRLSLSLSSFPRYTRVGSFSRGQVVFLPLFFSPSPYCFPFVLARCAARLFPSLSPSLISLVSTGRALKGPYVRFTRRSPALRRLLSAPLARSPNALTAGGALEPCRSEKFSLMQLFPRLYADSFVCVPSVCSGAPSRIACDFSRFVRFALRLSLLNVPAPLFVHLSP